MVSDRGQIDAPSPARLPIEANLEREVRRARALMREHVVEFKREIMAASTRTEIPDRQLTARPD